MSQKSILKQLENLRDSFARDGWGPTVDFTTAHVRDHLDRLIEIMIEAEAQRD